MKNLIKKSVYSLSMLAFTANQAFAAAGDFITGADPRNLNAPGKDDLGTSISTIINWFLGILGLIAVAFLIYAGVLMVTASGNEEQVTKARKIIMYAVIGIVIILLSYTIVTFVTSALG